MSKTVNEKGNTTIRLRNEYSAAATAWIVECHDSGGSRWSWSEKYLSLDPKPLEPGKETEFTIRWPVSIPNAKFAGLAGTCDDYHVVAAVFADGTGSGDLAWITAIVDERRRAYQDIGKALDMLNKAAKDGTDQAGVVKQFVEWRNELAGRPRVIKEYGETFGWGQGSPRLRPLTREAVPGLTVLLLQEQAKSIPDAVKALQEWRERLGQIKLVTEAGGSTPSPETRPRQQAQTARPPDPDLVGKPAPEFTLKDVDGREVALKDLRGKSVLLNFWATWCEPCRKEMPQIETLYKALKDKGLVVLAINVNESAETARKFFAEQGCTFQCLLDPAGEANKQYGAGGGIPRTVLIDKDGIVRDFQSGFGPKVDLRAEVLKLGL